MTDCQPCPRLHPKDFIYLLHISEPGFILISLLETWEVGWEELNEQSTQPKNSREGI